MSSDIFKEEKLVNLSDVRMAGRAILRKWHIVLLVGVLSSGIGGVMEYVKKDSFVVKLGLLLKSDEVYDYQNSLYQNVGFLYTDITNQMRVLRSYDLIEEVVSKLDLDVRYFIVGRVNTKEVFSNIPFKVNLNYCSNELYDRELSFEIIDAKSYRISFELGEEAFSYDHFFGEESKSQYYSVFVDAHPGIKASSANYLITFLSDDYWVNSIQSSLLVENEEFSSILNISLYEEIPGRAKMILDTLASVYLEYNLKSQYDLNANTIKYIDLQLSEVVSLIDSIEIERDELRTRKEVLDLDKETQVLFDLLFAEKSNLITKSNEIKTYEKLSEYLKNSDVSGVSPPSLFMIQSDKYIAKVLDKYYEKQIEINELNGSVKSNHLSYINLKNDLEFQKNDILSYIDNSIEANKIKLDEIQDRILDLESELAIVPVTGREFKDVDRLMEVNEKLYLYLLEKKANTSIAKSGIVSRTRVIEKARVVETDLRNVPSKIILFGGVGAVFGLLIVLVLQYFYGAVKSIEELREQTALPILGSIPILRNDKERFEVVSKSPISESFRGVRTSLTYYRNDQKKMFLTTSVRPGEGKTFVSCNLARFYAMSGKKVLVADFDLHKPRVHKFFSLSNQIGISNCLNEEVGVQDVVTEVESGLHVITSGPIPPNPSELVMGEKLGGLLEEMKKEFDYVFIDTPPVGLIGDALVLMQDVDSVVFIFSTKLARRKSIAFVNELVDDLKIKSKGLVLNGVKNSFLTRLFKDKYSYGYGYGYNYRSD